MTSSRRLKSTSLLAGAVLAGIALTTWTQPWFEVLLGPSPAPGTVIAVPGDVAAPAVSALALAALALVAALAIAGPFFRVVLAILECALGACITLSAVLALADPAAASAQSVTEATAVSGQESVRTLIQSVDTTAWPWVSATAGVLLLLLGLFVLVTGRRWPSPSRKYQAVRLESENGADHTVNDWDTLSDGVDPTDRRE